MHKYIYEIKNEVLKGYKINKKEALKLFECKEYEIVLQAADEIRYKFCGNKFNLCTIINAKSGKCGEDCKFCAQSSHFKTGCETYPLLAKEKILKSAISNQKDGAHRISLVTSGKGLKNDSKDMDAIEGIYKSLCENTNLHLCASFGIADEDALIKLKNCGVKTYHHNLETSRNYFPKICTTHSYDDRIQTIKTAQKVGLDVCSGGIFGMGESIEDRIDMAFDLRDLEISSVPINILTPIAGTPLESLKPVNGVEILKTIAIYRFILPDIFIRYAGGRKMLGKLVTKGLRSGINSALTGNFLTTAGDNIKSDIDMITSLGYDVKGD